MGLESLVSNVLVRYKGDTSDLRAQIRTLRGEQRAHAKEMLSDTEAANRKIDGQIAMWGKVTLAVGAAVGAYVTLQKAANAYLEDVRLESAAAGANIDGLRLATRGLVEEDKLLAFAGKSMNGVWKLNQAEMETMARGAAALEKTMGVGLAPTIDELTEAVGKGNVKAFKQWGIEAKTKNGVLRQMNELYTGLHGNVGLAGDDMRRSGVEMKDAFDKMQGGLGKLVVALTPAIAGIASLVTWMTEAIDRLDKWTDRIMGVDSQGGLASSQYGRQAQTLRDQAASERNGGFDQGTWRGRLAKSMDWTGAADFALGNSAVGMIRRDSAEADRLEAEALELDKKAQAAFRDELSKWGKQSLQNFKKNNQDEISRRFWGFLGGLEPAKEKKPGDFTLNAAEFQEDVGDGRGGLYTDLSAKFAADEKAAIEMRDRIVAAIREGLGAKSQLTEESEKGYAFLEEWRAWMKENEGTTKDAEAKARAAQKAANTDMAFGQIFGTTEQFDAQTEAIKAMSQAFGILQEAAGDAYDTLIKGGDLSMASFKKIIASGLAAMGKDFFIRGLGELAHAGASLAWGNFAKAGQHATNAGMYFVGAAAAGVAANALGYGSGAPSGGGGGTASAPSVMRRAGPDDDRSSGPINIYVGSEWAGMSGIEQSQTIQRAMRLGRTGSGHIRRG